MKVAEYREQEISTTTSHLCHSSSSLNAEERITIVYLHTFGRTKTNATKLVPYNVRPHTTKLQQRASCPSCCTPPRSSTFLQLRPSPPRATSLSRHNNDILFHTTFPSPSWLQRRRRRQHSSSLFFLLSSHKS